MAGASYGGPGDNPNGFYNGEPPHLLCPALCLHDSIPIFGLVRAPHPVTPTKDSLVRIALGFFELPRGFVPPRASASVCCILVKRAFLAEVPDLPTPRSLFAAPPPWWVVVPYERPTQLGRTCLAVLTPRFLFFFFPFDGRGQSFFLSDFFATPLKCPW